MGQHRGHGLEVVLGDDVAHAVERPHPGVDDDALGAGWGGEDVAAGLPRPGRERRDEHSSETIGQDGRMSDGDAPQPFGRVDPDGTVYVRTADGERAVGQVPDVPAGGGPRLLHAALRRAGARGVPARAARRLQGLVARRRGRLHQDRADGCDRRERGRRPRRSADPAAGPEPGRRRGPRGPARGEGAPARGGAGQEGEGRHRGRGARHRQRLAGGVNRFRSLLEDWKALPRLDRATDDALWHRFSTARTTYTRRRKAQFAQQNGQRESAREVKEQLVAEAEALATSTDWGPTTGAYRDLMTRWKAAGAAPRGVDETALAALPCGAGHVLRGEADDQRRAGRRVPRERRGQDRLARRGRGPDAAGHRPRCGPRGLPRAARALVCDRKGSAGTRCGPLDTRLHAIEAAVTEAEDRRWNRTNPEALVGAEDTAAKLEAQIATLEEQAAKADRAR